MPVVSTTNFVDRLRDITRRIDIRPSLQNVSKRWHSTYDALSVGSPQQVQEFYKYIKVYKQCAANDLLFMNMTVQLARAAMFPTRSMFKQMLKFEKHMDGLILAEGFHGIYASRGIEILGGHNDHLLRNYRKFKRQSEIKRAEKEMKMARKNAKQMAALREVRSKLRNQRDAEKLLYPPKLFNEPMLIPGEGPIPERSAAKTVVIPNIATVLASDVPEASDPKEALESSESIADELSEINKYCEILKAQMGESEKKREEDDVAEQLNQVVQKLIANAPEKEEEEDEEDDEDEEEDENSDAPEASNFPDFQACNLTDDQKKAILRILLGESEEDKEEEAQNESDNEEELEKIEEKDLDALEYEML